jgi:hypothetical protein
VAKLEPKVKRYIVQALACFDTPSQVAAAVKEEFGIEMIRQHVATYDPTKVQGRDLSKELRVLFDETRKRFVEEVESIPVAQQSYRLRQLQRMTESALSRNNAALAAQLLEQAAKEVGGAYTNRREVGGPGGGAIPISGKLEHVHSLPDDELERIASSGRGGS